jgi:hypothetical protein
MMKPGTSEFVTSAEIIAGGSEDQFKNAINNFYTSLYDVSPLVTRKFLDSAGSETSEGAVDVHSVSYTIETPTALSSPSIDTVFIVPGTSTSNLEISYPVD